MFKEQSKLCLTMCAYQFYIMSLKSKKKEEY